MEEKKRQKRTIGSKIDRFTLNMDYEMGQEIRKEARRRGLSLSKFIGEVFEEYFNKKIKKESV